MKAKLIAKYGALAHEKKPLYRFSGNDARAVAAECEEEIWVEIPEELKPRYNHEGWNIIITVAGGNYLLSELLNNHDWEPCIMVPNTPYRNNDILLQRTSAPDES